MRMKRILVGSMAFFALIVLSGCGEPLELTVTPIKNVDKVMVTEQSQVDVYCQTGICQFNLASNQATSVTVNMHYNDTRSFNKIEGVSITGKLGSSVNMADENTFSLDVSSDSEPLKIQVVDYYRN
ncbi:spore gernimation protein [Photobacterium sp. SDRW27]|uniref:spore gernimation protein n=1 Tax=Photobacterium obscurum TaxID=2829490 RepID=UPI002243C2BC|nr:spore gernimation protein [Photobacterium obscurum]MCW8331998.1 spore gernimation protein [Photobacterium obscurum]